MGIKLKDFASTIEIRHTFLNLTISNYFININHIVTSLVLCTKNERTFAVELSLSLLAKDNTTIALLKSTIKTL